MTPYDRVEDDPCGALVLLTELPQVGERLTVRVGERARAQRLTLAEVLRLPPELLRHEYGLPARAVERLFMGRRPHEAHCRAIVERLHAAGGRVSHPGAKTYPRRWRERLGVAPPLVYLYGNDAALKGPTLAVLNSRIINERTVTATVQVVQNACRGGFSLVGGGMKSTHRIAAVAMRATDAPRAIVLDRGLFAAFGTRLGLDPFGFGPGRCPLDPARTLVLSPFRPLDHAAPRNGQRRDELVAALADVVVAVNAQPGGIIERVCLQALDRGQCVLSWQGENEGLVAAGATPIDESHLRDGLRSFLERS